MRFLNNEVAVVALAAAVLHKRNQVLTPEQAVADAVTLVARGSCWRAGDSGGCRRLSWRPPPASSAWSSV